MGFEPMVPGYGTRDFQSRPFGHSGTSPNIPHSLYLQLNDISKTNQDIRFLELNGEDGIRTHDRIAPIPVFETGPFTHSGTSPYRTITQNNPNITKYN